VLPTLTLRRISMGFSISCWQSKCGVRPTGHYGRPLTAYPWVVRSTRFFNHSR